MNQFSIGALYQFTSGGDSWRLGVDYPKRYGSTTARNLLHSILPTGAKARVSSCVLSSPASRIRTLSLNASTDRSGRKYSTAGYLHRLTKYGKLRINGFKVTTKNGPMTRWDTCPQLCSVSNCSQGKFLLLNCLLDGELTESHNSNDFPVH